MKLFLLKNIFTTLIIFLSFFYSSFAQEKLIYYPSGIDKVTEQKDLVYSEPEGKNLYFNFYSKTAGNSPKPLVIIMNGFGNDQMRNAFFQIGKISIALRLIPRKIKTLEELNIPKIFFKLNGQNFSRQMNLRQSLLIRASKQ